MTEKIKFKEKKKSFRKLPLSEKIFDIVNVMLLTLFVIATLYPIVNTIAISLNDGTDSLRGGIYLLPRKFSWNNYKAVKALPNLFTAAKITVLRTVVATGVHLLTTSLLAYVLCRKDFVFKKQISVLYVITMYVNGGLIPTLILYKSLGFMSSFWVYIIPGMVSAFNMIVIRTYMNGLPESLFEAAEVDGAGHLTIFFKIVLPLCKPVLATVALFIAVYQWNSWFDTMLYNRMASEYTTLQYELMKLLSSVTNTGASAQTMKNATGQLTQRSLRAAVTIVTAAPIVCIYPFLQRYFVSGLTIGGIKE